MSIDLSSMPTLGFGMMRLPETGGKIDHEHVCRMVDLYMETGIRAGELMEAESFKINRRLERQKARKYVECEGFFILQIPRVSWP